MYLASKAAIMTCVLICGIWYDASAQLPPGGRKPLPASARIVPKPPGPAPEVITLSALGPTTVRIAWAPVPGIRNYEIARAGPEGNVRFPVSAEPPEMGPNGKPLPRLRPSYLDLGRMPSAQYAYYVIVPYPPTSQYSDGSKDASITMPPGLPPAGLSVAATGSTVVLSWLPAPDATGYLVIRDDARITAQPVRATTYTDAGVASGVHSYRVASYYRTDRGEIEGETNKVPTVKVVVSHCSGSH